MRVVVLFLLMTTYLFASGVTYPPFIQQQIELTLKLDDDNISDSEIEEILQKKQTLYQKQLEEILENKRVYLDYKDDYASKIYKLQKIIAINKRRGNEYAAVRDEVLVRSYKILQSQNKMLREILAAMDSRSFDDFSSFVSKAFVQNQQEIGPYIDQKYKNYLQVKTQNKVVADMKRRIEEYYAIIDINADILKTIAQNERKMYRLNKYSKYGLISAVLYVNNSAISRTLEPFLNKFNLSTAKILLIFFVVLSMVLFRISFLRLISKIFKIFDIKNKVVSKILAKTTKPVSILATMLGLHIIFYIYNDFSGSGLLGYFFRISYTVLTMWILYRVLNIIATAKIETLTKKQTAVKSELVNITIKIVNFILLLTTVLIILHQLGVNLTAILSGLGIGGFAIALAAKDSLANFFGTLSILMSNTFSQGDWIVVDDKEGVVVEIGLRVTTIRTFDNALISIPNSKLANEAIKNWSKRQIGRRIKFSVSVRYDSDKEALHRAIAQIAEFLKRHDGVAKEENAKGSKLRFEGFESAKLVSTQDALGIKNLQLVTLDELGDSSIKILVYCFSVTTDWVEWAKVKDEVVFEVMKIVEENGLKFAYPTLSLYHEEELSIKIDSAQPATIPATKRQN